MVKSIAQAMVLREDLIAWHIGRHSRDCKNLTEIQSVGFPVINALAGIEQINSANQIIKLTYA